MSWNNNIIHGQGFGVDDTTQNYPNYSYPNYSYPNYANSDDSLLQDRERPRDEYGFRLEDKINKGLDFLNIQTYLDTSGSGLSYQEVPINEDSTGTIIKYHGNSIVLTKEGFVGVAENGMYLVSAQAQNTKDGEFVVARLYEGPVGWKHTRGGDMPIERLELSMSSLTKLVLLYKGDILKPLCGTKGSVGLSGTLWFSVTKIS